MLFLALLSCAYTVATFTGGGSATVTLSALEGSSDLSFEVPGITEDQLDELFSDGHKEVWARLDGEYSDPTWKGALIYTDDYGGFVQIQDNHLGGFEPCGLPLTHAYMRVQLDQPYAEVAITDWPQTGAELRNPVAYPEKGVYDWYADGLAGASSVDVEVTCPVGAMAGVLHLEWALDAEVSRDARTRIEKKEHKCWLCES